MRIHREGRKRARKVFVKGIISVGQIPCTLVIRLDANKYFYKINTTILIYLSPAMLNFSVIMFYENLIARNF
jgi:hypothetical protein